jgi:hypothetical protein
MNQKSLMIIMSILFVSLFMTNVTRSQTTSGGTGVVSPSSELPSSGTTTPDVFPGAPNFPDYMVYPREDLNPFEMSTMGDSTEGDFRKDLSTFGTSSERPSNIEVNSALERKPEEENVNQGDESSTEKFTEAVVEPQSSVGTPSTFPIGKPSNLYTWTDDEGVLHVTNDLGSVPKDYQEQVIKQSLGEQ